MKIHLIQSALNQNTGTELQGDLGECSQGSPAMGCGEEARPRGLLGRHLGLVDGRASVPRAKSDQDCPKVRSSRTLHAVGGLGLDQVQRVFMTSAWQAYLTYQREPAPGEKRLAREFLTTSAPSPPSPANNDPAATAPEQGQDSLGAWEQLAQALLLSNELMFVD